MDFRYIYTWVKIWTNSGLISQQNVPKLRLRIEWKPSLINLVFVIWFRLEITMVEWALLYLYFKFWNTLMVTMVECKLTPCICISICIWNTLKVTMVECSPPAGLPATEVAPPQIFYASGATPKVPTGAFLALPWENSSCPILIQMLGHLTNVYKVPSKATHF